MTKIFFFSTLTQTKKCSYKQFSSIPGISGSNGDEESSGRSVRKLKLVPLILRECAVTLGFVLHLNVHIQPGLQRLTEGIECAMGIQ